MRGATAATARKFGLTGSNGSDEKMVKYAPHRRHQTQVMFSGCVGAGPDGRPMKVYLQWVCEKKEAKRTSVHHKRGEVYSVSATMNADYNEKDLRACGKSIRAAYKKLGKGHLRVKLQIDSAGGHGLARGHGNFDLLKDMMLRDFNIDLIQQPGNTPFYSNLDLTIRQAAQLEIERMDTGARYRELELAEVVINSRSKGA